jgi:hypothetical protein
MQKPIGKLALQQDRAAMLFVTIAEHTLRSDQSIGRRKNIHGEFSLVCEQAVLSARNL